MMSIPLSTSTETNEYINVINSEFNFQLIELTVFRFSNSDECKLFFKGVRVDFGKNMPSFTDVELCNS